MFIFSGVSGSKSADVAAVAAALKESIRQRGYPPKETVAVIASAASMGETIPPSIMMILLGSITTLSIGGLFLAGVGPAVVATIAIILGICFRARGGRLPRGPRFGLRSAVATIPRATPVLVIPAIILFGILGGVVTPTEASSVAVVYGIGAVLAYRSTNALDTWRILRGAILTSGMVLWLVAAASLLIQAIVLDGLIENVHMLFRDIANPTIFLAIAAFVLIICGMLFEALPVLLILAPVLIPVGTSMGIDPLQMGIVVIIAIGIGLFMPPFGVGLYITAAMLDAEVTSTFRPSMFYTAMHIVGLAAVIAFPQITLSLPHAVLGHH
jgi:tripartite ATP-independent transporter DctM subunit